MHRPTAVSESRAAAFEREFASFRSRLDEYVTELLGEVETPEITDLLQRLVFTPNEALPKRSVRPTYRIEYVAEQVYRSGVAGEASTSELRTLLQFTVLVQEYYDIADDILDGDVAEGSEPAVFVTNEYLFPLATRRLGALGAEATRYWADRAVEMVDWFRLEVEEPPAAETYVEILDRQSRLYGAITGLSALVAGGSEPVVEEAAAFGRSYFRAEQLLLDGEQYAGGDADPWNAWELMAREDVLKRLRETADELDRFLDESVEPDQRRALRPLVAVDLDAWADKYDIATDA